MNCVITATLINVSYTRVGSCMFVHGELQPFSLHTNAAFNDNESFLIGLAWVQSGSFFCGLCSRVQHRVVSCVFVYISVSYRVLSCTAPCRTVCSRVQHRVVPCALVYSTVSYRWASDRSTASYFSNIALATFLRFTARVTELIKVTDELNKGKYQRTMVHRSATPFVVISVQECNCRTFD